MRGKKSLINKKTASLIGNGNINFNDNEKFQEKNLLVMLAHKIYQLIRF